MQELRTISFVMVVIVVSAIADAVYMPETKVREIF
jgi:hypothetical protein